MLKDIMAEVERDLKLTQDISLETVKTHSLFNKYFNYYSDYKKAQKKEQRKLDKIVKFRSEYYQGKCSPEVYQQEPFGLKILKSDLPKYLQSDKYIQEQESIVDDLELTVEYLDNIIKKHINSRQFQLKTMMDYLKFSNGQ